MTSLCTVVGAVPGAHPAADGLGGRARARSTPAAWALFAILFLWQLPHFLAIGWIYREDYARGGFPDAGRDRPRRRLDRAPDGALRAALIPVTLARGASWRRPGRVTLGRAGARARLLRLHAARFAWTRSVAGGAASLFLVSVLYLPVLLGLMVFDR